MKLSAWRRACKSPRLASVIIFSARGRISLAFAMVVSIFSFLSSDVTSILSNAFRWLVSLPNCLPAHPCLISASFSYRNVLCLARLFRQKSSGLSNYFIINFHSQRKTHLGEYFFNFIQGLSSEILGL